MEQQPSVILIPTREDEGGADEKGEGDDYCSRSIEDEYRNIADLTGFDYQRDMPETKEACMRWKKRKIKKTYVCDGAQEEATVDAEKEQVGGVEVVEATETYEGNGVVKSNVVIDLFSSSTEENQLEANVSCCRGAEKMVPADAVVFKSRRRRRRRRRKKDKITKTCEAVGMVLLEKKVKGGGIMKSLGTESLVIKDNIVLRKLLRGPRYFDAPCSSSDECPKCGELHTALNCTAQNRKKPCFLCGGLEHSSKNCRQSLECSICKGRGHRAKHCLERNQGDNPCSDICLRCGESGHDMLSCTTDYSPDDLKETQCYVCKNFGHLCCVDLQDLGPGQVSCYNCGESSHLGPECTNTKSHGKTNGAKAVTSCRKCREEGHSARRCKKSRKKTDDSSTVAKKCPEEMEICIASNSAPENPYEEKSNEEERTSSRKE